MVRGRSCSVCDGLELAALARLGRDRGSPLIDYGCWRDRLLDSARVQIVKLGHYRNVRGVRQRAAGLGEAVSRAVGTVSV